jgi:hypothetical protein
MTIEVNKHQLERIIPAGIDFIRTITQELGAEKGMELWEDLSRCLGNDVKGQIFFEMLSGDGSLGARLVLRGVTSSYPNNKISAIKAVRNYCGLGLKEAKDIIDRVEQNIMQTVQVSNWRDRTSLTRELRDLGINC